MDGAMVDWGRWADRAMAGGMVAGQTVGAHGEPLMAYGAAADEDDGNTADTSAPMSVGVSPETPQAGWPSQRVSDSTARNVSGETSLGERAPRTANTRPTSGHGRWQVRETEPPTYDGEAPTSDPDPNDPATHQDRIVTLEDRMAEMAGHRHAHDYRFLVLVAEYDRLEGWKLAGHRSCAHAIHFNTGFALGACREKVRAARALERMPVTSRSMSRGELSFSKVRALTRVVDDLHRDRPEDEDKSEEEKAKAREEREAHLVEYARQGTTAEVERFIRSWRKLDRHGEEEAERRRHRSRYLWVRPDDEGMYRIRGRLDPEVGAMVMRAIEAAMDAVHVRSDGCGVGADGSSGGASNGAGWSEAGTSGTGPSKAAQSGDASSTDWAPEGGPRGPKRRTITARQKRADALGLLAEQALAVGFRGEWAAGSNGEEDVPVEENVSPETRHSDEGDDGASGASPCDCHTRFHGTRAERYQVFLHVDHETLAAEGEPGRSHLEDGTRVPAETARRLTCDASVVGLIEARKGAVRDKTSVAGDGSAAGAGSSPIDTLARGGGAARPTPRILDIGRKTRTIPPALRRALYLRDGGCRFPGCGVRFTEGHHVKHWALGGRTELANLISLCRFHHRAVHEEGFEVRRTRSRDFRFFDRKGWPLPQRPRSTGVGRRVESRFVGVQDGAAKGATRAPKDASKVGGGEENGSEGASQAPEDADQAEDETPQTLEQTNRELGVDPQWHTAAARFRGNVDDPCNGELRDLMFRAMDALDPVEDGSDPPEDTSDPPKDMPDLPEDMPDPPEDTSDPPEDASEPASEESGADRESLGGPEDGGLASGM